MYQPTVQFYRLSSPCQFMALSALGDQGVTGVNGASRGILLKHKQLRAAPFYGSKPRQIARNNTYSERKPYAYTSHSKDGSDTSPRNVCRHYVGNASVLCQTEIKYRCHRSCFVRQTLPEVPNVVNSIKPSQDAYFR